MQETNVLLGGEGAHSGTGADVFAPATFLDAVSHRMRIATRAIWAFVYTQNLKKNSWLGLCWSPAAFIGPLLKSHCDVVLSGYEQ